MWFWKKYIKKANFVNQFNYFRNKTSCKFIHSPQNSSIHLITFTQRNYIHFTQINTNNEPKNGHWINNIECKMFVSSYVSRSSFKMKQDILWDRVSLYYVLSFHELKWKKSLKTFTRAYFQFSGWNSIYFSLKRSI